MARLACLVLVVSLSSVSAATAADCASDRENLVANANCSFDRNSAGWRPDDGGGTAVHDAKEGHPRAGALRVDGGPTGSVIVEGPCLAARSGTFEVRGSIRAVSGTPYFCAVDVYQYADASCELDPRPVAVAGLPPKEEWQTATGSGLTDGDTASLRVRFGCSGEPGFVVLADNVVVVRR